MIHPRIRSLIFISAALVTLISSVTLAQQVNQSLYSDMRWRCIGPFRAGRTVPTTGVPGQPNVFYIGVNDGGVWKTDDYGRTWEPLFDKEATGSVGSLAVAPSNPDIVYVGTGEGLQRPDLSVGNGLYKSTDAGKTWVHLGLHDAQQIAQIIVDPKDSNKLFVAVLGHPYGPNAERGVFRSLDGGETFQRVLYKDENTGAVELAFEPGDNQIVYAVLWESRMGGWENGMWNGPESGLYKSTDGGTTWNHVGKGLPTAEDGLGRIGLGVSASQPKRLYANVESIKNPGVYRTEDGGETWTRINEDPRVNGRGFDFAEIKVDPKNADTVYIANTSTYKSTDGGNNFTAIKGAPGGDDYHRIWINPDNPQIMIIAADQGATITVNGGRTWSSWYNQPTAQFYHVITDNQFPYWVYGGQQESGSAGVASRGNDGEVTFREFHPVGAEEYGYIAPDPLNPDIIYGGKVTRYDKVTGQVQVVAPEAIRSGKYRFLRTEPLIFSTVDPHALYFAGNVLFKTTDGGNHWTVISPDLTREHPDVPENIGVFRKPDMANQPRRGVIYAVGPSYIDADLIWAGTDDGLVHVTHDGGKTWADVTPPALTSWSKVTQIDPGRFDKDTAYISVNRMMLDDWRPHIFRTHDGGKTWTEISSGIPKNEPVDTVREDPVRKGLLFAGTENATYFSIDDGDHWNPLRLNMPASSCRDLVVHDQDLVVGTHGRGFWILDDITPLRQISDQMASSGDHLFKPGVAYRIKRDANTDTPLPPEEPAGQNPPQGAIIDYLLKKNSTGPVVIEIVDKSGRTVRRFSSDDKPEQIDPKKIPIPTYWIKPAERVGKTAGMHRFVWDLHYPRPDWVPPSFPIAAVYRATPPEPMGPVVMPGEYTVKLTVDGKTSSQPLTVKMDPRVKTTEEGLQQQFELSMNCYDGLFALHKQIRKARTIRHELSVAAEKATGALKDEITALEKKAADIGGAGSAEEASDVMYFAPRASGRGESSMTDVETQMVYLVALLQGADAAPTSQAADSVAQVRQTMDEVNGRWKQLMDSDIPAINEKLKAAGLGQIKAEEPQGKEKK